MGKTVSIITLGCKVNSTDSQQIAEALKDRGYTVVLGAADADISIVNTCTVTARADFQSRQEIRRAARVRPGVPVVVTGCAASVFPDRMREAATDTVIVPSGDPGMLTDTVASVIGAPGGTRHELSRPARTRAFLKIQDGCNARCSYCIVPRARGRERSTPPHEVLDQLSRLVERGYKEVVLVGIHLGRYGADLKGHTCTLAGLLTQIEGSAFQGRIRLSSIEPMELTGELIGAVGRSRLIAPHLHIPLQSGDDLILESMGRPYRRADIERVIGDATRSLADPGLGVDVMVGFPGEGDREFSATIELIRSLPVSYLHVFPFSIRPDTPASRMGGQVGPTVKTRRARIARDLGSMKRQEYINRQIERSVTVLAESHHAGLVRGKSENYLDAYFPGTAEDLNSFVTIVIERSYRGGVYGRRSV